MALFRWRESMRVGVSRIDADHQHLIVLLNRLHYLFLAGADKVATATVSDSLVACAETHFQVEHAMMANAGALGLSRHDREHQAFFERLAQYRTQHRERPERFNVAAFYDFLADWLLVHVMRDHTKLKAHFTRAVPAVPATAPAARDASGT
jgi:hemerythrin-like metal-binding protein